MKKLFSILTGIIIFCSFFYPEQNFIIKKADTLLDMMEYKSAILYYMKALSKYPKHPDIKKHLGYAYFQLGKIDDAIRLLKEELNLLPDNGDAYDLLAYVLFKSARIQENFDFLESLDLKILVNKKSPNIGLGDFILGMYFKEKENYAKATKFFRKALERGHEPIKCYVQLIDMYSIDIRLDKDIERPIGGLGSVILNEVREAFGGTPSEIHFLYGLKYFEKSKTNVSYLAKSIESFNIARRLRPDFDLKDALFNLACINYNRNKFEEASEYFRRVLAIEPENTGVKFYLDCCLDKLNKSVTAKSKSDLCPKWINLSREFIDNPNREYKHKLKNDPSSVLQKINDLALEYIKRGRFQEALKRLHNGLKIYPESPVLNLNIGIVNSWLNNLEEAEKHTLIALRKKDYSGEIPVFRKQKIFRQKKASPQKTTEIPLSEWDFEVALREGNNFSDAYNHLGNIYFEKKEFDKSILAYKKTIEIYPKDPRGHFNLGCVYRDIGHMEKAEEEWKKALKYAKELKKIKEKGHISEDQLDVAVIVSETRISYKAHKFLGRLYLDKNLTDKALKEFTKAIGLEPGDPEPYYEVGKIYQAKSELNEKYVEKAIFYYEKYLYLGGEKEEEVKKLLKSLK